MIKCVKMINELSSFDELIIKGPPNAATAPSSVPQSPIGVLDAACLSYKTDETAAAAVGGSCANSSLDPCPVAKRRKLVNL